MKHNLHEPFYMVVTYFYWFVCFPWFKKLTNEQRKTQNLAQNRKLCENSQKSTKFNINFCDNCIDRSLQWSLSRTEVLRKNSQAFLRRQGLKFAPPTANSPPPRTDVFAFVTEPCRLSSLSTGATPPPKIPPGDGGDNLGVCPI